MTQGDGSDNSNNSIENILDRLDALLSARMDDELTSEERVELEMLIESHPEHAERARHFDEVDAELRSYAASANDSSEPQRLADTYEGLRTRLGLAESDSVRTAPSSPRGSSVPLRGNLASPRGNLVSHRGNSAGLRPNWFRAPVIPLFLAAAAALVLYLVIPRASPVPAEESATVADAGSGGVSELESGELTLDAELEEELMLVLGYGEEMSELQGITRDDLDIIEQLELLDFLSDLEEDLGELEERG